MAFKIYYDGGKVVRSWEIKPESPGRGVPTGGKRVIPPRGIIGIIQDDTEAGWTILTGFDYYVRRDDLWIGANYHQMLDILIEDGDLILGKKGMRLHHNGRWNDVSDSQLKHFIDETGYILTGRMTSGLEQEALLQKAVFDAEFAPKSKWYMNEPDIAVRAPGVNRAIDETNR